MEEATEGGSRVSARSFEAILISKVHLDRWTPP